VHSSEYRRNIRTMVRTALKKKFPGLKQIDVNEIASRISVAVHARFYGANVDGVESPIWRDDPRHQDWYEGKHPTKTAEELLNE
jgi:hypothetical protein